MADVLPMPALKLSNPVIFRVGMVADNPSFHANVIARAHVPALELSWRRDGCVVESSPNR